MNSDSFTLTNERLYIEHDSILPYKDLSGQLLRSHPSSSTTITINTMAVIKYAISFFTYLLAKKFLRHSLQNSQNFISRNNDRRNGL